jgi:ATP-binding cassette subfamily B protein
MRMQPTPTIKQVWQMMWPSFKPMWGFLPLFVAFALVGAVFTILEPFLYGALIDTMIASFNAGASAQAGFEKLIPYLLIWAGAVVGETGFAALQAYFVWHFGNVSQGNFMQALYARMLRLDIRRFYEERAGELLRRFDNMWEGLWTLNAFLLRDGLTSFFRILLALAVGLWLDPRLMLAMLVPVPLVILIGYGNLKYTEKEQHRVHKYWEEISGHVGDSFANIATVKGFLGESRVVDRFRSLFQSALVHQSRVNKKWAAADAGFGGVYIFGRLVIFVTGAWLVVQGTTTIGTLITFLGMSSFVFGSVQQLMSQLPEVSRHLIRIRRMATTWYETPDIQEAKRPVTLKGVRGEVTYENVSFMYPSGHEVLRHVTLMIPDGKTVALVGESGAGKSTLSQLLIRFYDPTDGRVLIDGQDIRSLSLKSLRSAVGFVMQENLLFNDTIMNNIRFARPSAPEKDIVEASKRAQAHGFIQDLKNGYETHVGERGVKLSGGQKQRIALARVLLANPPILVLDEATSALDSKTEHELQAALKEVMKNRTTLVIAHRLSTVMSADNIVVLDKGKIVDQGTHAELISRGGIYKQFWEIQAGGYV